MTAPKANHATRVYDSILSMLSSVDNPTPLVRLNRVSPFKHTEVYAKLEWYNPFGAVKDRVAANLLEDAEARGILGDVRKLVEPTSGNTGLGLAMMANAKGYHLTTPLSDAIPLEKRTVLRFFGADVIELDDTLCPAPGAPEGAIAKAMEIAQRPDFHQLDQYQNLANPGAHEKTTGPEIWRQTEGRITHFVASLGTCGTITGNGRYLKGQNPEVKIFGAHPTEGHDIPGVRSRRQLGQTKLFFPDEYDGLVEIGDPEAYDLMRRLNQEESIIAGPSCGLALAGAFRLVEDKPGNVVVVIFADNIFKYATSVRRHMPEMFPAAAPADAASAAPTAEELLYLRMVDAARNSADIVDVGQVEDLQMAGEGLIIDVRTPGEFESEHIEDSVNVPLDALAPKAPGLPADLDTPIVTVCNVGRISLQGMLLLKAMGYRNVRNLMGGLNQWMAEGMPLVDG